MLDDIVEVSAPNKEFLVDRMCESMRIKCHSQFLLWLQSDFQQCIPHQIFIAAWGDFSQGLVQHDVVSAVPSIRTGPLVNREISRFVAYLFGRWAEQGGRAFSYSFDDLKLGGGADDTDQFDAFYAMRSALVHGFHDKRVRHDCLYVFLSANPYVSRSSLSNLAVVLPSIDTALRQVTHLPCQYSTGVFAREPAAESPISRVLSDRELQIMDWVKMGKTNYEIGKILNISTFTVKNHMQRIFRRLEVSNRAQASSSVKTILIEPAPADLCDNCPRSMSCNEK